MNPIKRIEFKYSILQAVPKKNHLTKASSCSLNSHWCEHWPPEIIAILSQGRRRQIPDDMKLAGGSM